MISTDVLILGGGLTGLSTAYHLERLGRPDYLLVEKESRVGGRAGSVEKDGFVFDHTGHLLHLHDAYAKGLVTRLLRGNLALLDRSSWIHSHGKYTRYPFQANTYGLPPSVVAECVAGFMKERYRPAPLSRSPSFKEWYLKTFGQGISKHFITPYNLKLWRTRQDRLTTEWLGRFFPRPSAEEVLYGALVDQKKFFGYNAHFRYPVRGGTQVLPDALAARLGHVHTGCRVLNVDLDAKTAVIDGLGEVRYERLVNTMPLPGFLDLAVPLPAAVRRARSKLRWVSVHNLNIGVKRPLAQKKHWAYFPEPRYPFYRVGFYHNFSKRAAPRRASSMYIEVARRPDEGVSRSRLERQCLDGLRACGLLKRSDRIAARVWIPIECAYVIFDRDRPKARSTIFPFLARRRVESIGRWGSWKYSFMEEAIIDGKHCAERLLGRRSAEPEPKPKADPSEEPLLRALR